MSRNRYWMLVACLAVSASVSGAELLPVEATVENAIDQYLQQTFETKRISPAPLADDSTFIRRLTLDLAGRIPTMTESRSFVLSTEVDKRAKLVERLITSPDFAFHFRNSIDTLLMPTQRNSPHEWREYLLKAVRANRPWDQLFREMIAGNEENAEVKPALTFLKARNQDLDQLTNDTSSLFFGVNVSCAKCHDHPLVEDWKQDHYFGMATFFQRTYATKKNVLAEKFSGEVKFKTTKGVDKVARIMFLTGVTIDEPIIEKSEEQKKQENDEINRQTQDDKAGPPRKPDFSPREKLVELALHQEHNRYFSRNIVNRVWAMFFGRGLVHPLDQMHSANPASHPELLEWLSRDLVANHYDLQRLVRGIAMSDAYARSSTWDSTSDPPMPEYFALAIVRPLSPRQYSLSLRVASQNPETMMSTTTPDWPKRRDEMERNADGLANQFESPGENFQIGVDEAMYFSNSPQFWSEFVRADGDGVVASLMQKKERAEQIDIAYWTILSRAPVREEVAACEGFLADRTSDPTGGFRQFVWSLLSSPELRFNH